MQKKFIKSSAKKRPDCKNQGSFKVKDPNGMHARVAASFVKVAKQFDAEVTLQKDGMSVDGKSILAVLMLGAEKDSLVHIEAIGPDSKEAIETLGKLIAEG